MTYNEFIQNIITTRGQFNCGDIYHERHHIIPKCLGGSNDKSNLIDLFAHEHLIAHKLLVEEHPDNLKLLQAYNIMAFTQNKSQKRQELSPEEYEEIRTALSTRLKDYYSDKTNHPCYGTHLSEERKKLISESNKGNKYCVGRVISEATREKISQANSNPSPETREKMSKAQKARNLNGGNNPRARKVIRLSDGKIYGCMKEAAEDNQLNYGTFKDQLYHNRNKNFAFYEE